MCFHEIDIFAKTFHIAKKLQLKDIQTTANVYTHISNSRKNDMAIDIQHTFSL